MKPFNANPNRLRQQWVRAHGEMAFHLRVYTAASLGPSIPVACGHPMPGIQMEFSLSPYQRCAKCDAVARQQEQAA